METPCHRSTNFRENDLFQYRQRCNIGNLPLVTVFNHLPFSMRKKDTELVTFYIRIKCITFTISCSVDLSDGAEISNEELYLYVATLYYMKCSFEVSPTWWLPRYSILNQFFKVMNLHNVNSYYRRHSRKYIVVLIQNSQTLECFIIS